MLALFFCLSLVANPALTASRALDEAGEWSLHEIFDPFSDETDAFSVQGPSISFYFFPKTKKAAEEGKVLLKISVDPRGTNKIRNDLEQHFKFLNPDYPNECEWFTDRTTGDRKSNCNAKYESEKIFFAAMLRTGKNEVVRFCRDTDSGCIGMWLAGYCRSGGKIGNDRRALESCTNSDLFKENTLTAIVPIGAEMFRGSPIYLRLLAKRESGNVISEFDFPPIDGDGLFKMLEKAQLLIEDVTQ